MTTAEVIPNQASNTPVKHYSAGAPYAGKDKGGYGKDDDDDYGKGGKDDDYGKGGKDDDDDDYGKGKGGKDDDDDGPAEGQ